LENSILLNQKAVKLTPKDSPAFPFLFNTLAAGFIEHYTRNGKLADLENSILYWQKAVKLTPDDSPYFLYFINNLANGLKDRYSHSGKLADLENSISFKQKVVKLTADDSPYFPAALNNLAAGLIDRYSRNSKLADLENSILLNQKAVKLTLADSPDLPKYLNDLSAGLRELYPNTLKQADLENSILFCEKAVKLTTKDSPNLSKFFNNLASGLRDRYAYYSGELADLKNSISYWQKAVKLTPDDSPDLPMYLNNMASGLRDRYAHSCELAYLEQGKQNYEKAAEKGSEISLEWGLNSAKNWLIWAFERQSWQEVTQAYSYAYKSSTRLVQTQLLRQHQESWLKDIQGLAAKAAYAYAKIEYFDKAVVTLERGLAQLLSETLAREQADLEDLKSQRQDLYQAYKDAIEDWQQAQFLADIEKLKAARQKLDTSIDAICEIKGYEDFLAAPEFKDIAIAGKNTTLVYLLTTDEGGLALIVSDNKVKAVWLPEFTDNLFREKLDNYFENYDNWQDSKNEEQWFNSLEEITAWLWSSIMEPLIEALPKDANCTLIPTGLLALLPLHAAWKADNTKPTGKYYALDALTIAYAPNARSLYAAQQIAAQINPDNLLAIQEPFSNKASKLPHTQYEVKTVTSHFLLQQHKLIKEKKATRAAIIEALPNYNVLHFSGHGFANLKNPEKSGLLMANDEVLTLEDLLKLRLKGIRLVTLSACETGLAGTKLPDEVVNLPTGLLQAGVAGVAASLWTVADLSTMMLISYFYDLWRIEKLEPVQALRQAQIWMRDTTDAEKLKYFKDVRAGKATVRMAKETATHLQLRMSKSDQQTYQHPFHWAAFGFVGV
jgi:CHAT domain-containing protein/tetratricopeptide (TPR) repeat protein